MIGWLSAHSIRERDWKAEDLAAMDRARAQATEIVTRHRGWQVR
jgi:hypothetical protein